MFHNSKGDLVEPANLQLHNNEQSLLCIDKNDPTRIINFDLGAGKIVEEYDVGSKGNMRVEAITGNSKNAGVTAE